MSGRTVFIVVGHLTPTDADPDPDVQGKLDDGIQVVVCKTQAEVDHALLWYLDGVVREV